MSLRRIAVLFLLIAFVEALSAQQYAKNQEREQSAFAEDEPVTHQVQIPQLVLDLLLSSEAGQQGLAFANDKEEKEPAKLFRASEVHLGNVNETDLVVIGICPMCGADNGWFWIVRSAYRKPKIVLFAGGNSLKILPTRTNGCKDVKGLFSTASSTSTTLYHFDGRKYKVWKKKWTDNPY